MVIKVLLFCMNSFDFVVSFLNALLLICASPFFPAMKHFRFGSKNWHPTVFNSSEFGGLPLEKAKCKVLYFLCNFSDFVGDLF